MGERSIPGEVSLGPWGASCHLLGVRDGVGFLWVERDCGVEAADVAVLRSECPENPQVGGHPTDPTDLPYLA